MRALLSESMGAGAGLLADDAGAPAAHHWF
jgi:hypothetical protein